MTWRETLAVLFPSPQRNFYTKTILAFIAVGVVSAVGAKLVASLW